MVAKPKELKMMGCLSFHGV